MHRLPIGLFYLVSFCFAVLLTFGSSVIAQELNSEAVEQTSAADSEEVGYESDDYDEDDYDEDDYYVEKPNFTLESGEELPRSERSQAFHSEIEKVLSGDDFAHKETITRRRFIDLDAEAEKSKEDDESLDDTKFPEWIIDIVRATEGYRKALGSFAQIVEILIWVSVVGLIVFIIVKYRSELNQWASALNSQDTEPDLPTTLFGLDIKKESIPDDVVKLAQDHWARGEPRQAIATLLRASLIKLLHEHSCRFFSSDTESECCERIDQQAPKVVSTYMRLLVGVWQRTAYAHIEPNDHEFNALCEQWNEVF